MRPHAWRWPTAEPFRLLGDLCGPLLGGAWATAGATLALRRYTGGIQTPPGPALVLALSATAVVICLLIDRIEPPASRRWPKPFGELGPGSWLARIGMVAIVFGIGVPWYGSGTLSVVAAVLATVMSTVFLIAPLADRMQLLPAPPHRSSARPSGRRPQDHGLQQTDKPSPGSPFPTTALHPAAPAAPPDGLLQQWQQLRQLPDGTQQLTAGLVLNLLAGEKVAHGYVGFCPAFAVTPHVETTTDYDELEVLVSASEVLPWGVRIECRIDEAVDEDVFIPVALAVTAPAEPAT
jgi:hypothetical protein